MVTKKEDDFLKKLENLSKAKHKDIEQVYDYNKVIRCISSEHEDKNPSMVIFKDKALCQSCGYTIPNNEEAKPYKSKIRDLILKEVIDESEKENIEDFSNKRKYNLEILKKLRIGYFNLNVFNKLLVKWGMINLDKAGLINKKHCMFINKIIIPINESHFTCKPGGVSIKKSNKLPYIIDGESPVIICEGECDAIALHHIYKNQKIIALCGAQSQKPLKDITEEKVWLCFDNDEAGEKAEYKATLSLKTKTLSKVYFNNKFKDIDEVWREYKDDSIKNIKVNEFKPKDLLIPKDFTPITKEEYKKIIIENFPRLWDVVDVCLSVISVNKLKEWTDPVNVNLVGAPSSEKTTAASFFYNIEGLTYKSDDFTPKCFVSHSVTVTKDELNEIDLLPRIKDMCFITPELAPLFSKRKEDLTEVIGILTRVFDGEGLQTDSGAQGRRGYEGEYLFSMLGATTPLPKTAWNIMGRMGSRMFFYYVPDYDPEDEMLNNIINGDKSYGNKLKICKEASIRMIQSIFINGQKRDIEWNNKENDDDVCKVIVNCSRLLARLRASIQVWEDEYKNEVLYETPLIEKPMRIVNVFLNIAKGHAITEGRNYTTKEDVVMIPKIMASTMPEDRMNAFDVFLSHFSDFVCDENQKELKELSLKEVAKIMCVSEKVARKTLKTLEVLQIIEIIRKEELFDSYQGTTHKDYFVLNKEVQIWLKNILSVFPFFSSVKSTFLMPSELPKIKLLLLKDKTQALLTLAKSGKVLEEIYNGINWESAQYIVEEEKKTQYIDLNDKFITFLVENPKSSFLEIQNYLNLTEEKTKALIDMRLINGDIIEIEKDRYKILE